MCWARIKKSEYGAGVCKENGGISKLWLDSRDIPLEDATNRHVRSFYTP